MQKTPEIRDNELYHLLREGNVKEFNERRAKGENCDLTGCDFRNLELQGLNADDLDLSNCYFRQADLRGIDFQKTNLRGASLHSATISGAYFPAPLKAAEIRNSVELGTRMRYEE